MRKQQKIYEYRLGDSLKYEGPNINGCQDNAVCRLPAKYQEPEFYSYDPYYSNQVKPGTCVKHAIAKAIYREINFKTEIKINISISNIITGLNAHSYHEGDWVTDWDGVRF